MKKYILGLALVIALLASGSAFAQQAPTPDSSGICQLIPVLAAVLNLTADQVSRVQMVFGCNNKIPPSTIWPELSRNPVISVTSSDLYLGYDQKRGEVLRSEINLDVRAVDGKVLMPQYESGNMGVSLTNTTGRQGGQELYSGSVIALSNVVTGDCSQYYGPNSPTCFIIPAGSNAQFRKVSNFVTRSMFAGAYYASLSNFGLPGGGLAKIPDNRSNTVVIIGERSPYITNISVSRSPGYDEWAILDLVGVRFNSGALSYRLRNASGQEIRAGDARLNSTDGTTASVGVEGLPNGFYSIQLVSSITGASNSFSFQVGCVGFDPNTGMPCGGTNLPPVISGVSGPTTLQVGETGTWSVRASDPENAPLSYSVNWGEGQAVSASAAASGATQQTATFTHSYSSAGNYSPTFTVTDTSGQSARTSISVNVGGVVPPQPTPTITVVSPNGGTFGSGQQMTIEYTGNSFPAPYRVALQLNKNAIYPAGPYNPIMTISDYLSATGRYSWTIPAGIIGDDYSILVSSDYPSTERGISAWSNPFTITSNVPPPPTPPSPYRFYHDVTSSSGGQGQGDLNDGNNSTGWSARAFPPQWVELRLNPPGTVSKIRLYTNQSPAGQTTHKIYAGSTPNPTTLVRTISGNTSSGQWLEAEFSTPLANVQYIRILTTASPSWVAWNEIEVHGYSPTTASLWTSYQYQTANVHSALRSLLQRFGR